MTTTRPTILLDCDGPLADFTGAYLSAFCDETGRVATEELVDRWDIHECEFFVYAADQIGLDASALRRLVDAHVVRPGFCSSIKPRPEAQHAVFRLHEIADVYVVTSPWHSSVTWMHERLHWCVRHFGIAPGHVIQAGRKHLIRGDIFVDDKPSHVAEWQAAWPLSAALLFDLPHNRQSAPFGVVRAGWPTIVEVAERIARYGEASR